MEWWISANAVSGGQWSVSLSGVPRHRGDSIYQKTHPASASPSYLGIFVRMVPFWEFSLVSGIQTAPHLCFMTVSCHLSRKSTFLSTGHSFWTIVRGSIFFSTDHNSQKTLPEGKPLLNMILVRSSTPSAVLGQCAATTLLYTRGFLHT